MEARTDNCDRSSVAVTGSQWKGRAGGISETENLEGIPASKSVASNKTIPEL